MAKVTAADLKKHHYWILSGLAPLFTLLAVLFLWLNVGTAVSKEAAENKKDVDAVKAARPKGKGALEKDYPEQKSKLLDQKKLLWEKNYERQKAMFDWPKHPLLEGLETKYTKFGQPIPRTEDNALNQIRNPEVYERAYEELAKRILPTGFAGGSWKGVLRYVSGWGEKTPTDKQLWLALEDLWVQRGLLLPINDINAAAAEFKLVPPPAGQKDDPLHRTFQSRIWRLELTVPKQPNAGGQRRIECRLTNITDRLQALGNENTMRLNLTVSPNAPPVLYRIQSALVPAGQTVEVRVGSVTTEKETPERDKLIKAGKLVVAPASRLHAIQVGIEPVAVTKVVQLLDERNAPVRRIDDVVLGARARDARHATAALQGPSWYPADAAPAAAAGGPPGGGLPPGAGGPAGLTLGGGGSPDSDTGGAPSGGRGVAGGLGAMGGAGGGAPGSKAGGPLKVLDGSRDRYIDVTSQVRRMPVALVLVIDQMFLQDALAAYSNSTLRFQVTQFHWSRFRGTLGTGSAPTGGDAMGGGGGSYGSGGPGGGGGGGPPLLGGDGGDTGGGPGMIGGGGGMLGGGSTGAVSEEQVTSGLIELSLYGVVTLYEKFDAGAPAVTPGETPAAPTAPAPAPAGGAPVSPAAPPGSPAVPASPTPTTGKQ